LRGKSHAKEGLNDQVSGLPVDWLRTHDGPLNEKREIKKVEGGGGKKLTSVASIARGGRPTRGRLGTESGMGSRKKKKKKDRGKPQHVRGGEALVKKELKKAPWGVGKGTRPGEKGRKKTV